MKRALIALAAVLAVLAVSIPGAFGRTLEAAAPTATPGVTSSTITIGGTFPLSGPASPYGPIPRGMEAYFKWVNTRKGPDGKIGIRGRKIVWKYYDDGYNPAQTVQLTNKLILEDKIFADVGSLGTEHNQAIRPLLNDRKIPQILVATGASYWGLQYKQFPWTIGWQPDYIAEGRAYGDWIKKNAPNAKIAVFYQNDDYGKDYLRGLNIGLGAKKSLIVTGADLRGDRHELCVPARTAKGIRSRHVGAGDDADPDRACDRDGQGAELEAEHDRDQLGGRDRLGHEGRRSKCGRGVRGRSHHLRLPEEQLQPEVPERPESSRGTRRCWPSTVRAAPTRRTRSTSTGLPRRTTS